MPTPPNCPLATTEQSNGDHSTGHRPGTSRQRSIAWTANLTKHISDSDNLTKKTIERVREDEATTQVAIIRIAVPHRTTARRTNFDPERVNERIQPEPRDREAKDRKTEWQTSKPTETATRRWRDETRHEINAPLVSQVYGNRETNKPRVASRKSHLPSVSPWIM